MGGTPGAAGGGAGEANGGSGANTNGGASGGNAGGAAARGGADNSGAGTGSAGTPSTGGSAGQTSAPDRDARRLLLRDEGISQLSYVDLAAPAENWHMSVPVGRDMQLVGAGRVMIGTESGYQERLISDGSEVDALTTYAGTLAAHRLRNGNTLLVGLNWQGQTGIVLVEVGTQGSVTRTVNFPDFDYVRLVRPTATGTFMVTADDVVFEGDDAGNILWQVTLSGQAEPHAWKALRLASGNTVVATGYNASLQIFSPDEQLLDTLSGPAEANPFFFCDFQVLTGGNFLVTNWQGHGADLGNSGTQLIEYAPSGDVVWSWQQDPSYVSSLQAVIALDGLDLERLHTEDGSGELVPVP